MPDEIDPSAVLGLAVPAPLYTANNHGVYVIPQAILSDGIVVVVGIVGAHRKSDDDDDGGGGAIIITVVILLLLSGSRKGLLHQRVDY